jgi:hypothetical protein
MLGYQRILFVKNLKLQAKEKPLLEREGLLSYKEYRMNN